MQNTETAAHGSHCGTALAWYTSAKGIEKYDKLRKIKMRTTSPNGVGSAKFRSGKVTSCRERGGGATPGKTQQTNDLKHRYILCADPVQGTQGGHSRE